MRNWHETLEWYDENQTTSQIGFNPDGMCLKVCRTARNIGSMYPTAKAAQDATPKQNRFYKVADLRRGMVLYFDDPNDSNRFGHIVTMVGRVRGGKRDSLDDILVETNSVVKGQLVVVRGTYFKQHWGDAFKFGANWLNGQWLDVPSPHSVDESPATENRVERFWDSRPNWNIRLLDTAVSAGKRRDIAQQVSDIHEAVAELPDLKNPDVQAFKKAYKDQGLLKVHLLHKAVVEDARMVRVKEIRNRLRQSIKSLPRH